MLLCYVTFFQPFLEDRRFVGLSGGGRQIIESNENRLDLSITVVAKPSESGSLS